MGSVSFRRAVRVLFRIVGAGASGELAWRRSRHCRESTGRLGRVRPGLGASLRAALCLLIRTAKIIADGREFLCIIRDASATGLKVRLFSALPQARAIHVELVTGDRYRVELGWQADDHAGLRFLQGIEIEQFLDENRGPSRADRSGCGLRWKPCCVWRRGGAYHAQGHLRSRALVSDPTNCCS